MWLGLTIAAPTAAFLVRFRTEAPGVRGTPGEILTRHLPVLVLVACSAVLVRIGWHLRGLLRTTLPANVAAGVGTALGLRAVWLPLFAPLAALRDEPVPNPWPVAGAGVVLTAGIVAWAAREVGPPRRARARPRRVCRERREPLPPRGPRDSPAPLYG